MKEIYDWVPWFQELVRGIADEGEAYLNEKARQVDWGENLAQLKYGDEGIDPFSFVYFLASKAATKQLKTVYEGVSREFGIHSPLPDASVDEHYIFPTPPGLNVLFHNGKSFNIDLLWRLFRQAVPVDPEIEPNDFKDVLEIKNVATPKLTQSLFLINPRYFLPVDNSSADLSQTLDLPTPSEIESGGYETYRSFLDRVKRAFPGCQPYEINMLLYLQNSEKIQVSGQFYQISTYVYDPGGGDYWENRDDSFKENNWVFTGGGQYPHLTEPIPGNIVLVRTGIQMGRAIGVVYKNDYHEDGEWTENGRIHVLWINKSECKLPKGNVKQQHGFSRTTEKGILSLFARADGYGPSFELIGKLNGEPKPTEDESEDYEDGMEPGTESKKHLYPLNQILYGPPGTGKTWNTVDYALAIIEDKPPDVIAEMGRQDKLRRFNELKENGQIEMVTFHQNYNYEDFIEGIRPVLSNDMDEKGKVEYELSRGVFREISERASENRWRPGQAVEKSWDIDELIQAFAEWIDERLKSGEQIKLFPPHRKHGAKILKINWSDNGIFESVSAGRDNDPRSLREDKIREDYKAFNRGEIKSEADIKPTRKSRQTQHARAHYYFALFQKISEFQDNEWEPNKPMPVKKQNYVLIIDEINRGNIAKIFGELITLIEESKRIGGDDQATVTLPYSKREFGVPDNLYIIGTMNTADRSIALLDTALRRRFEFVEMMPDPELVSDDVDSVNCRQLLATMNERIRFLLDREHQIGHTYFMNVKSIDSLASTFKNKIVPLLQEYFYDNWEKIELVLKRNGFIEKRDIPEDLRAEDQLIDVEKKVYEVLAADDDKWHDPESYRAIYEQAKSATEQGS